MAEVKKIKLKEEKAFAKEAERVDEALNAATRIMRKKDSTYANFNHSDANNTLLVRVAKLILAEARGDIVGGMVEKIAILEERTRPRSEFGPL